MMIYASASISAYVVTCCCCFLHDIYYICLCLCLCLFVCLYVYDRLDVYDSAGLDPTEMLCFFSYARTLLLLFNLLVHVDISVYIMANRGQI